jgi:rfaE bifunctional protein nucleotidyltransferase chain/domain
MSQIIEINQPEQLKNCEEIVLVGGCFDILHLGHVTFLEEAKKLGKNLVVLLESDETIKRLKGENRPINRQIDRAEMLTKLKTVDYVVMLPELKNNQDYIDLIKKISPKIIAVSEQDEKINNKKQQAKLVGARLIEVTKRLRKYSTSEIIRLKSLEPSSD